MKEKDRCVKMCRYVGRIFILGILVISVFVWITDPFYHYHSPMMKMPIVLENAVYQTAGAAKNLKYDSAIVGTSMTENFHTGWFDEDFGWKTMKLSYSGARSADLKAIFTEIQENESVLSNVVMDINFYQLTSDSWTGYVTRPEYLYDQKLLNDYKYLLNRDVVNAGVRRVTDGILKKNDNIDVAYVWESPDFFGEEKVKATVTENREALIWERYQQYGEEGLYLTNGELTEYYEKYIVYCKRNLENIIPFIQDNPETTFHVLIPPYSILYWEERVLMGVLEDTLAIYAYAIKELLQCENVKIYYFQDEKELITQLDNYRDNCHHTPEYNRYMFECIRDGKNVLTKDNYKEAMRDMYEFAATYPYEQLWIE